MSIFVKAEDTFTITFVVGYDAKDAAYLFVAPTKEVLAENAKDAVNVEEHSIVLRFPSYRDNTDVVDNSIIQSGAGFQFKTALLRFNRLVQLMKSWTFKDEKGELVPINEASIGALHPVLASYIGNEIEAIIGVM